MKRILYTLFQLTWGIPQSLAGFVIFLINIRKRHFIYHGAVVTEWSLGSSVSLGLFVFVSGKARPGVTVHEYGHCIQSMLLGPLYLIAVGVPSYLWANLPALRRRRREKSLSYYAVYPENWANRLGEWAAKEKSCGRAMPVRRISA